MNILLTLSFKGSCMAAGYYVLCLLLEDAFSHRMRYFWLKLSLVGYLLPLYWLRKEYAGILRNKLGVQPIAIKAYMNYNHDKVLLRHGDRIVGMSWGLQKELWFVLSWVGIAFALFVFQLVRSHRVYRRISQNSGASHGGQAYAQPPQAEKGRRPGRRTRLYLVDGNYCCSDGLFSPFIIMKRDAEAAERNYILEHELTHIRRWDSLFKAGMYLAVCIHWFNPLIHLLKRQMERECELSCDDRVVGDYSTQERAAYAGILVKNSLAGEKGVPLALHLEKSKILLEERIINIMDKKEKNLGKSVLCAALMAVILFGSSFTVLAYDHVVVDNFTTTLPQEGDAYGDDYFILDGMENPFKADIPPIVYDEQFVDEDGNIYNLAGEPQVYADCTHNYVSGQKVKHEVNRQGGCTVTVYKAQRCTLCGNVVLGDIISTTNYPVCPH